MLYLNRFCNKAYRNLNFMVTWYINSEKFTLAVILALDFVKHSSIYKDWVQHKYNTTDCMVVNPITVNNFASLFVCMPEGRASDSMTAPA